MRSQTLSIKFSRELVTKMTEAAKKKYITRSAFIREAVAEKLNREQATKEEPQIDWEKLLNDES
jgi:predicted transcriptional regulator